MALTPNLQDREKEKFVESPSRPNGASVEVVIANPEDIITGLSEYKNPLGPYQVNNLEDSIPLYVGKSKTDGTWLVERFNETTGSKDYANLSNNLTIIDYAHAWSNRLTLNFVKIQSLTGV